MTGVLEVRHRPTWRKWRRLAGPLWNVLIGACPIGAGSYAFNRAGNEPLDLGLGVALLVFGAAWLIMSIRQLVRAVRRVSSRHVMLRLDGDGIHVVPGASFLRWDDLAAVAVSVAPSRRAATRNITIVHFVARNESLVSGDPASANAVGISRLLGMRPEAARMVCFMTGALSHGTQDVIAFAREAKSELTVVAAPELGLDLKDA